MTRLDDRTLLRAWERGLGQHPTARALALLALAGTAIEGTESDWAAVDVGSREVLLARLLEALVGGSVWAGAECGSCRARLEVPVDVAAVARYPVHPPGARFVTVAGGVDVAFRLPTTEDLAAVRAAAPAGARRLLLTRCLGDGADPVPTGTAEAVERAMERVSPAGAVVVIVACPNCGTATPTGLDISVLLWAEVEVRAAALLAEVHALATAYGWTEAEVLALSPARRGAYLELAGA